MQFYKIQVKLVAKEQEENGRRIKDERIKSIKIAAAEYNGRVRDCFCFVSEMDAQRADLGVIAKESVEPTAVARKFAEAVGLEVWELSAAEITLATLQAMLGRASRIDYIEDDDDVLESVGLEKITGHVGRSLRFGENLVEEKVEKEELVRSVEKCFACETLLPELDRIYMGKHATRVLGHPVHYIVEADDRDVRREMYQVILNALHDCGRLVNRRYAFLDFRPGEGYSHAAYEDLYRACFGGAVVARFLTEGDEEDGESATDAHEIIENICAMAKSYRNRVLTIICLPRACNKLKATFYDYLDNMAFVEVREDFIRGERAEGFLRRLAKEQHVRTDKQLLAAVQGDQPYLAAELREIFENWYNDKLKNSVYPQYKDVAVMHKTQVKPEHRGNAYDELEEMIGLGGAKAVIRKALNYYKLQKLYAQKGVKRDNPAMHMVFTGNPGTAKTTVARLFARIMRENGLLSKGQLVEVGRGDLVGKYVGWTAQTVQAKFKQAIGGVLFIDEAYSLVDDRGGSYGDEAINTIVQEMENHRADVVVIFAGYPEQMEGFLQKNPGLRSRIAFHVPFADYDSKELCEIARLIGKKNGMRIEKAAMEKLETLFESARTGHDFGNGRYVRNVFEQAKMNQATRLLEGDFDDITTEQITTITAADIMEPPVISHAEKRRVGFF